MTYPETIKYLNSFINYEKKSHYSYRQSFKLERFRKFLKFIHSPQSNLNVIHIAGSKGKGSVSAFIAYILKEAGFKIGLYTSPHLSDFRERIRILNQISDVRYQMSDIKEFEGMISKKDICDLVKKLKSKIEEFNKKPEYGDLTHSTSLRVNPEPVEGLTFFEVCTAVAFQYFKEKKVDFVVLETGLGGRLDATNIAKSLLSIITPISLEHTYLLGNTLKKIAFEKASIIKKQNKKINKGKILALISKQDKSVMSVIEKVAKNNNALLFKEGRDFKFIRKRGNLFDYQGLNYKLNNLGISLLGSHQVSNASLAVASIEALRYHNVVIGEKAVRRGLKNCFWPARFEVVLKNPLVILDGAQNSASVRVLRKAVKENFSNKKIWLIFGISGDKELKETCREVERFGAQIILTKSENPRAAEPGDLLKYFSSNSLILTKDTKQALNIARTKADKKDLILVTGSLFVCGELRELLRKR